MDGQGGRPDVDLAGWASPIGGEPTGRYQQEQIRSSTLYVVQGHEHTLFLTAPVEFGEQLESFLAGL